MSDKKFKSLCLVLTAIIILFAAWELKDYRLEMMVRKANLLATTLAEVNNKIVTSQPVALQINAILTEQGYTHLQRIIPEPAVIDTTRG